MGGKEDFYRELLLTLLDKAEAEELDANAARRIRAWLVRREADGDAGHYD